MLKNTIRTLPPQYADLMHQIDDGLIRGVLVDASDIPGYVAFTFNPDIFKRYERKDVSDFKLSNIRVYDNRSSTYLLYEIYISTGTISGYALTGGKKRDIDVNKVDTSNLKRELIGDSDYSRIVNVLNESEKKLLNPSEVYSVIVDNREFFHLKDLEDGDFIGIDKNNFVFRITHDPLEIAPIERSQLINILSS